MVVWFLVTLALTGCGDGSEVGEAGSFSWGRVVIECADGVPPETYVPPNAIWQVVHVSGDAQIDVTDGHFLIDGMLSMSSCEGYDHAEARWIEIP